MNAIRQVMGAREWTMLVSLAILWGGSFFFNEVALGGFQPLTAVALRVTLAAAILWVIVLALGHRVPRDGRSWLSFLIMGSLNNAVPFSLILWAQSHISSSLASILNATTPLFAVLVGHAFLADERASASKLAGVIIGLAGVVLMLGSDGAVTQGHTAAELAVLAAAVSYAVAGAYGRRFAALPPTLTAAGQVTGSTCFMLPAALLVDQPWNLPSPQPVAWTAVTALAVLSTALAYCLYFAILKTAGATNLMLVTFLVPVSAIFLGLLLLDESLMVIDVAGLAAIAAGLSLIDGRLWRLPRQGGGEQDSRSRFN